MRHLNRRNRSKKSGASAYKDQMPSLNNTLKTNTQSLDLINDQLKNNPEFQRQLLDMLAEHLNDNPMLVEQCKEICIDRLTHDPSLSHQLLKLLGTDRIWYIYAIFSVSIMIVIAFTYALSTPWALLLGLIPPIVGECGIYYIKTKKTPQEYEPTRQNPGQKNSESFKMTPQRTNPMHNQPRENDRRKMIRRHSSRV